MDRVFLNILPLIALLLLASIGGALASADTPTNAGDESRARRHDTSVLAHQFVDVAQRLRMMDGWSECERTQFPEGVGYQRLSWPPERGGGVLSLTVATGHVKSVTALSTSADNRYLISASEDNTAIIWDARRLQQLLTLKGQFRAVALSPDGSYALTGGDDGWLRLWDTDSAAEIGQHKIDQGITAVRFLSDGNQLLASSSDCVVRVFDRETGKILSKSEWPCRSNSHTAIAPDHSRAAFVSGGGSLFWWDVEDGRELHNLKTEGKIVSLAIAADGRTIAAVVEDDRKRAVAYWDVESDRLVARPPGESPPDTATLEPRSVAFSSNGSSPDLFVGSATGAVHLLSGIDGKVIVSREPLNNGVLDVSFVEDDGGLLTAHSDGSIHYWSTGRGATVRRFETEGNSVRLARLTSDGRRLLAASHDALRQWDLESGGPARVFRWDEELLSREFAALAPREIVAGDDRHILINNADVLELWDARRDALLRVFQPQGGIADATVMATGQRGTPSLLVTASRAGLLSFFDVGSGSLRQSVDVTDGSVTTLALSWDEQRVLVGDANGRIRTFDSDGTLMYEASAAHQGPVLSLAWSANGDRYATGDADGVVRLWDAAGGNAIVTFDDHGPNAVRSLAFSAGADELASGSEDGSVYLHDLTAFQSPPRNLSKQNGPVTSIALSPRGRAVAARVETPSRIDWVFEHLKFSRCSETHTVFLLPSKPVPRLTEVPVPDSAGTTALVTTDQGVVLIYLETGQPRGLYRVGRFGGRPTTMVLSNDAEQRYVLVAGRDRDLHLFDRSSGRLLEDYRSKGRFEQLIISPDLRYLLGRTDTTVALWDREERHETLFRHEDSIVTPKLFSMAYLAAAHTVATGGEDGTARFWNAADGTETQRLEGHVGEVGAITFSADGAMAVTGSREGMMRLWDVGDAALLASAIAFPDHEWGVSDPVGRYDAANGGDIEHMYWVYRKEVIGLSQLKSRYFEPGLLGKILGVNNQPLRPVSHFNAPRLFPEVQLELVGDAPDLRITLRDRGGGVGAIAVAVNGRRVIEDARQQSMESDNGVSVITVSLSEFQHLLVNEKMVAVSGQENAIAVRAENEEGYLFSRLHEIAYPAPVTRGVGLVRAEDEEDKEAVTQRFWAVVAGISNYAGEQIDLRYAAKDAQNMAKSLSLAATRLFGVDNVHISLLISSMSGDVNERLHHGPATKEGFRSVFEKLSRDSRAQDVLVVYLAGHGVSIDGQYHYLTSDATGVQIATDPEALASNTVSSAQIEDWLRRVPALKQVVILDTCAAGSAATEFTNARFVSTAQARELERMKDRTGFHILMGSAADAVSYEATRYEQGLLTYSLLQGMKGAAIRDDEFVDVSQLFQYAADEVPRLASVIGGIQAPIVAAPRGTSFSIGQLDPESRQQIPLSQAKPLLLPPDLYPRDPMWVEDASSFEDILRTALRDASHSLARGAHPAVYVDARKFPGAILPSGSYTSNGDTAAVVFVLMRDGRKLENTEFTVEGSKTELSDKVVTAIYDSVRQLKLRDQESRPPDD